MDTNTVNDGRLDFMESAYLIRAQCVLDGMNATNKINEQNGEPLTYNGNAFFERAEEIKEFMIDYSKAKAKAEKDYLNRMKKRHTHTYDKGDI